MKKSGAWGWLGILAWVLFWDSSENRESLTSAFKRWPLVKWLIAGMVLAHLRGMPQRYDAVHYFGDGVYRLTDWRKS